MEQYYPIDCLKGKIEEQSSKKNPIMSIEFFLHNDGKFTPFHKISSLDSSVLYVEHEPLEVNVHRCNSFLLSCLDKIPTDEDLYFLVTL